MAEQFVLRLVRAHMLAPTVRHLVFERADGGELAFIPGQFLQVHFEYDDGKPTKRSYSVATVANDPHNPEAHIEIAVSYVEGGAATRLLSTLIPGETVQTSGPYGRFVLFDTDKNARYLLVATGTGVTPYRAMLPDLVRHHHERGIEVVLLQGARSAADLLYAEEFDAFADAHPWFRYVPCLSREARLTPRADDRSGYVQHAFAEFAPDATRDIAYLCGNPNMVDASFETLKEDGLPVPAIRREKYLSSR
ncbi:MAG: ferredoxin--NADP reductase [Rhodanobacteraceae bacterium]|nr:ferredoxin--NADP reductase [Rhodanobacteraceae bacterium]